MLGANKCKRHSRTEQMQMTHPYAIRQRPRGRPFPRGHKFGHRFKKGNPDGTINLRGRPRTNARLYGEYVKMLNRPFRVSEIRLLPRWLRPHVREYAKTKQLLWCDVLAVAVGTRAAQGDVRAAREIRSATEGGKLAVRGEIELFNHDLISQLLARRPSGD